MNLYLKNIALLFCIIIIVMMESCKQDPIIGNYSCIEHSYSWSAPNTVTDVIIGPAIVNVSRSASGILINGLTGTYDSSRSNSDQDTYITGYALSGAPQFAYLIKHNDSIWFQTDLVYDNGVHAFNYYTGHKQ